VEVVVVRRNKSEGFHKNYLFNPYVQM